MTFSLFRERGLLTRLGDELGSPFVINMGLFGGKQLVIQDGDAIASLLNQEDVGVQTSWPESILKMVGGESGAMRKHGKEYMSLRARAQAAFSADTVRQIHFPLLIKYFTYRMDSLVDKDGVLFSDEARRLAFGMAVWTILGDSLSIQEMEELLPTYNEFSGGIFQPAFNLAEGLPGTGYWKAAKARQHLVSQVRPRIDQLMRDYREGRRSNCAVHYILDSCVADNVAIDDALLDMLVDNVIQFAFAGTDTSSSTLMNVLVVLQQNPDTLRQLREEQARVVEQFGDDWTFEVLQQSPFAKAVVAEILRTKAPIPLIFRKTKKDLEVLDVRVPKDTTLQFAWGKALGMNAPWTPERWMLDGKFHVPEESKAGLSPFGGGRRRCWGEQLARVEILTMVCMLSRGYEWNVPADDLAVPVTVFGHKTGLPVRIQRRMLSETAVSP